MTAEKFKSLWTSVFPNAIPFQHLFREDYNERWFRIHSLPESKRYAETEEEWQILLSRQNRLVTDLLDSGTNTMFVTGEYNFNEPERPHITETELCFSDYQFKRLDHIEMNKIDPSENDVGYVYCPAFTEIIWRPNEFDTLLRSIANDEIRGFFVSFEKSRLVAPYDGGIDIILEDTYSRNAYKEKYKDWLSTFEGGL